MNCKQCKGKVNNNHLGRCANCASSICGNCTQKNDNICPNCGGDIVILS